MTSSRAGVAVGAVRAFIRGWRYARRLPPAAYPGREGTSAGNALERYFDSVTEGPGIWKWRHYFEIYDRHLSRFRHGAPKIVEIGVYSGGSLLMWREYFGSDAQIHGVDIEPACTVYAATGVHIHIGDQADPAFWRRFIEDVGNVDIVIDDGGHEAHQQIASLEALLPSLRPGGVYICEDTHGALHGFHSFVDGLTRPLSAVARSASPVQQHVASVHRYPLMTVIEKPDSLPEFSDPRHGTHWQPFL